LKERLQRTWISLMPRRPRCNLDHVPLHIVQRGHNQEPCFFADADYQRYLVFLRQALAETDCTLHAYVLMTNHVHLLLTPRRADEVSNALISLGRRYVQHVNRAYQRTGTLWDSRYRSSLIQSDRYLLACQRYIELNPVRAGIVRNPADYPWSSYRVHALGQADDMVSSHPLYWALGREGTERQLAYRKLFDERPDAASRFERGPF
jgi:putative transposase